MRNAVGRDVPMSALLGSHRTEKKRTEEDQGWDHEQGEADRDGQFAGLTFDLAPYGVHDQCDGDQWVGDGDVHGYGELGPVSLE